MAKKRTAAKAAGKKATKAAPPRPHAQRLPGTEDARIAAIETVAEEYAAIRDDRQALTRREVDLKKRLLAAMKANGKRHYQRDGIECDVVVEEETVKVKIRKAEHDEDAAREDAD